MRDDIGIDRAFCLHEGLLKRPPDCHDLPGTFHGCGKCPVCPFEFVKRPAGLGNNVIDGRFKGGRSAPRHGIRDFIKPETYRYLCCNTGNRVPVAFEASADERETRGFTSITR